MKMSEIGQKLIGERNYSILIAVSAEGIRAISCRRFFSVDLRLVDVVLLIVDTLVSITKETYFSTFYEFLALATFSSANHNAGNSDSAAYIACNDLLSIFYNPRDVPFQFRGEIWQPVALRSERHYFGRVVDSFVPRRCRENYSNFVFHAFIGV